MDFEASPSMSVAQFRKLYGQYCNLQGERMKLVLPLRNQHVELPLLWRLVASLGGSGAVTRLSLWPTIAEQLLSVSANNAVAAEAVKNMFQDRLAGFEQYMRDGSSPVPSEKVLLGNAAPFQPVKDTAAAQAQTQTVQEAARSGFRPLTATQPGSSGNQQSQVAGNNTLNIVLSNAQPLVLHKRGSGLSVAGQGGADAGAPSARAAMLQAPAKTAAPLAKIAASPAKTAPCPAKKRQKTEQNTVTIPTANIVAPKYEPLPDLPAWALNPNVFFPAPKPAFHPAPKPSTRDPRIDQISTRDPRVALFTRGGPPNTRDPRQQEPAAVSTGFQPLLVSQQRQPMPPRGPTSMPQIRPLADPFSSLNSNANLRAKGSLTATTAAVQQKAKTEKRDSQELLPTSSASFVPEIEELPGAKQAAPRTGFVPLSVPPLQPSKQAQQQTQRSRPYAQSRTQQPLPSTPKRLSSGSALQASTQQVMHPVNVFIPSKHADAGGEQAPSRQLTPPPQEAQKKQSLAAAAGLSRSRPVTPPGGKSRGPRRGPDPGAKERAPKQVSLNVLAHRPDVSGWPEPDELHSRALRSASPPAGTYIEKDRKGGAIAPVYQGIAYIPPMRPAARPSAVLSNNREWQQAGISHSPAELDVRDILSLVRLAAATFSFPVPKDGDEPEPQGNHRLSGVPLQNEASATLPMLETMTLNPLVRANFAGVQQAERDHLWLSPVQKEFLARFRRTNWEEEPPLVANPSEEEEDDELVELAGRRRSRRTRNAPAAYKPTFGKPRRARSEDSDDEAKGILEGPEYQAELPALRPKPRPGTSPTKEEAGWLANLVSKRGAFASPHLPVPVVSIPDNEGSGRKYAVGDRMGYLLTAVEIANLGLDRMGLADAVGWTDQEISLFEEGLNEHKRDFEHIARTLLPMKGPHRVGSFYYNVWKTRAIPQARAWYRKREEDKAKQAIEKLAAEALRQEAQTLYTARRQLKEGLAWLKSVARYPLGHHLTK